MLGLGWGTAYIRDPSRLQVCGKACSFKLSGVSNPATATSLVGVVESVAEVTGVCTVRVSSKGSRGGSGNDDGGRAYLQPDAVQIF